MNNYHYAHIPIEKVSNPDLQGLFDEIANLRTLNKEGWVLHFLQQAFYPLTPDVRVPFDKKKFTVEYFLPMKIKTLKESEIYKLCIDLARISKKMSIEDIDGCNLYAFLNKTISANKKPKGKVKR